MLAPALRKASRLLYPSGRIAAFNPKHPVARGGKVRLCAVPVGGGSMIDLSTGTKSTTAGSPTGAMTIAGPTFVNANNATDYAKWTGRPTTPAAKGTIAAIGYYTSHFANIFVGQDTTATGGVTLLHSASKATLNKHNIASVAASFDVPSATPVFYAASWDDANGVNFLVLDLTTGALLFESVVSVTSTFTLNTGDCFVGCDPGNAQPGDCHIAAAMIAEGRQLSLPEMLLWAADPWSFWYGRQQ